jgi:hypothetical protein
MDAGGSAWFVDGREGSIHKKKYGGICTTGQGEGDPNVEVGGIDLGSN